MRVVDLSLLFPGPYCAGILGDLGAEVIKVERPGLGDWVRYVPPHDEGGGGRLFRALNHGKKSLTVNLKSDAGREVLLRLVESADVLLESFRPGVMERLGLGYEVLSAVRPRLVYCSLTGYGPDGEYRDRAGHDLNYAGLSGLLDLTGPREGPPVVLGAPLADLAGALWATVGILAALLEREQTGRGQKVDASLLGGALSCLPLAVARQQGGDTLRRGASDLTGGWVCYNVYEARDGGYVTLAALEPEFWAAFCQAAGRPDLLAHQVDPAVAGEAAYDELVALFRSRTRAEWADLFSGVDACCEPVLSVAEALSSAPVQALAMLGADRLLPPLRLSARQFAPAEVAPALGQHTDEVLLELGYGAGDLGRLREEGTV